MLATSAIGTARFIGTPARPINREVALRFSDFRLDASSIKELADGSIKVTAQLTHAGIFTYRNPDGSPRREYRPAEEVFRKDALETFAGAPVTMNHPTKTGGERKVTAATWKQDAVGHCGDSIRQDGDHAVAELYIRDAAAVSAIKGGTVKYVSLGYHVRYDATPGVTPTGERYDGIQRDMRGNHIALLKGYAPRGGAECVLRLDAEGDETPDTEEAVREDVRTDAVAKLPINLAVTPEQAEALNAQITVLKGENATLRTDAAEVAPLRASVADLTAKLATATASIAPERLDALVEERQAVCAAATAAGVDPKGKASLQVKREIIAKRTPALALRVDSYSAETVDAVLASYGEQPHPSMAVLGTAPVAPATAPVVRTDAASKLPTISELFDKSRVAESQTWKTGNDLPKRTN